MSATRTPTSLLPSFLAAATLLSVTASAQLFENLKAFPERPKVGDPGVGAAGGVEGPKGIAAADLDGDGNVDLAVSNLDGTVSLLLGRGDGKFRWPAHLQTDASTLRGIIAVDLDGDSAIDLATAAPLDGKVFLFFNKGAGSYGAPTILDAWPGARNLIDGDFDGDGIRDLAVAGPGRGVRHYRGKGGGDFEVMGDLPRLAPASSKFPKPVYTLKRIRSRDGRRDNLVVTHADAGRSWYLGSVGERDPGMEDPPVDPGLQRPPRNGAQGNPPLVITEFMGRNEHVLADADGEYSDWVEVFNRSEAQVNLAGWKLGDGAPNQAWQFPALTLAPGEFLVVFASGKNRTSPGGEMHTNFRLAAAGESLSLWSPDGLQSHTFESFPLQLSDISYGIDLNGETVFYDNPSPGYENNAGLDNLTDVRLVDIAKLSLSPADPLPGEPVRVEVELEDGREVGFESHYVWFSHDDGSRQKHHLMRRVGEGRYEIDIEGGTFDPDGRYRVLAKVTDLSDGEEDTLQVASSEREQDRILKVRDGALRVLASFPSQPARSFDIGALAEPAGGTPDLITANRASGSLEIHRGNSRPSRFEHRVHQSITVPGGPRALEIIDLDRDGWNDLVVVLRYFDLAVTYRNDNGRLVLDSEMATGVSPRELAVADFDADGYPDSAVINRVSSDVSILRTLSADSSFVSLDQIYPTDGDVSGLSIVDQNKDGRDDVVQLHRASWEYTVRLSQADGSLGPPQYFILSDDVPGAQVVEDVNNDGIRDAVTANFGSSGSVSVRLGDEAGGFLSLIHI